MFPDLLTQVHSNIQQEGKEARGALTARSLPEGLFGHTGLDQR